MGSVVNTILQVVVIAVTMAVLPGGVWATVAWYTKIAIVAGTTILAGALSVKPKLRNGSLQQASYQAESSNRSMMLRQPIIPRDMVYGTTKKSGGILFMETTDNNKYLHIVLQVAGHEIQSFDEVYFNDEELTLSSAGNDAK